GESRRVVRPFARVLASLLVERLPFGPREDLWPEHDGTGDALVGQGGVEGVVCPGAHPREDDAVDAARAEIVDRRLCVDGRVGGIRVVRRNAFARRAIAEALDVEP